MAEASFTKFSFLFESSNFIIGNKYYVLFSSKRKFLEKISAKCTDEVNSNKCICFVPQDNHIWCVVEVLSVFFSFCHKNIKERCTQGLEFNNINNIYIFMKDILK